VGDRGCVLCLCVLYLAGDACSPCPGGAAKCEGGDAPAVSAAGYWASDRVSGTGSASGPGGVVGNSSTTPFTLLRCSPPRACEEGNRCAPGYQGELVRCDCEVSIGVLVYWCVRRLPSLLIARSCCPSLSPALVCSAPNAWLVYPTGPPSLWTGPVRLALAAPLGC
jgi:hypothetical protein